MRPIGFPETSFTQYQSAMRKIPEEGRSQKSGCLQSQPAFELAASSDSGASCVAPLAILLVEPACVALLAILLL